MHCSYFAVCLLLCTWSFIRPLPLHFSWIWGQDPNASWRNTNTASDAFSSFTYWTKVRYIVQCKTNTNYIICTEVKHSSLHKEVPRNVSQLYIASNVWTIIIFIPKWWFCGTECPCKHFLFLPMFLLSRNCFCGKDLFP